MSGINCTIRWNLGPPDTAVRLAGAAIDLTPRYASHVAATGPSVWSSNSPWEACIQLPEGPPFAADRLADAQVLNSTRIRFASDALSAHVEASRRRGGLHGYLFQAPGRRAFFGPNAGSAAVRAVLWLYVYRPPPPAGPAPLAARAPGRYARAVPRR